MPVDSDGDLSADDVFEVSLSAGFESLCPEGGDSISWQRFCRIPLGARVPHLNRPGESGDLLI